jgi:hypothetical protein
MAGDTFDAAHGSQRLRLFKAHRGTRLLPVRRVLELARH